MPPPAGGFLPYIRTMRSTGTRTLGQTLKAGQPQRTRQAAMAVAGQQADRLRGGAGGL